MEGLLVLKKKNDLPLKDKYSQYINIGIYTILNGQNSQFVIFIYCILAIS